MALIPQMCVSLTFSHCEGLFCHRAPALEGWAAGSYHLSLFNRARAICYWSVAVTWPFQVAAGEGPSMHGMC